MSRRMRRRALPRDMDASPFSVILAGLINRVPGAFAACLIDKGGEAVDYAGSGDPFDIKVAGAYWQIVQRQFNGVPKIGPVREIVVAFERESALIQSLPDDYVVVVRLMRRAGFTGAERAMSACIHALAREARWDLPERERSWFAIHVESDEKKRPVRIIYGGLAERVDVVGTVVGLRKRDRGYRIHLASGPEITIIREPGDFWYAEEYHGA